MKSKKIDGQSRTMPLYDFVSCIKEEIYSDIREEQEGELSLDEYTENAEIFLHTRIDHAVTNEYLGDIEELVAEYGIHKALCLYINEIGARALESISHEHGRISRCLLFQIVKEKLTLSFDDYKVWCESVENL